MKAKKNAPRVAVVGATGMVGRELLSILNERRFKHSSLQLFSSKRSAGEEFEFGPDTVVVEELVSADQIKADLVFFAAGSNVSLQILEKVAQNGAFCIDKSSAFRERDDVVLMVPEVNAHQIIKAQKNRIVASPNCVATPLVQVLFPLYKRYGLNQVIVSSYQAVSGAGQAGTDELESQVRDLFNMRDCTSKVFNKRIAFNVLPFIPSTSIVNELLKTEEEQKIINETKKILELPDLLMEITSVRVPVFNGHSMAVNIATDKPVNLAEVSQILSNTPGVLVVDNPREGFYPTPVEASGNDLTLVGRIRPNTAVKFGLSMWISSDNLRTGAALNAVKIAETIMLENQT